MNNFFKKNSFIDYQATQFYYDALFICRKAMKQKTTDIS